MNIKFFLLGIALLFLSIPTCLAQDYEYEIERARRMINAGDYERAAKTLRPLADGGNAEAQYLASKLFAKGWGVIKSPAQCLKYLQMSADQGYVIAVNQMIYLYKDKEPGKAARIAEKYCNQFENLRKGFPGAYLAEAYISGNGIEKNATKAMELAIEADDDSFGKNGKELKERITQIYMSESAKKYKTSIDDLSIIDSIYKESAKIGEMVLNKTIEQTPNILDKIKAKHDPSSYAIYAYLYYKGLCGVLQHKKTARNYAYKAMNAGSHMARYYYEKFRNISLPGTEGKEYVIFDMKDETTWGKLYCKKPVLCTWKEVSAVLKNMGEIYRLPSKEEAQLMMKYWMFGETNPIKTMNIWTSAQPGTLIYYWQTYNYKGELIKEEPYHGFVGSVYGGKCWVIGIAQHK